MPSAATVTDPCIGAVEPVTVRPVPASLARTVGPLNGVLEMATAESGLATGLTVRVTVAFAVFPAASVAVYVNESLPEKLAAGV